MLKLAFVREFDCPLIVKHAQRGSCEIVGIAPSFVVDARMGDFIMDYTPTAGYIPLYNSGIYLDTGLHKAVITKYAAHALLDCRLTCRTTKDMSERSLCDVINVLINALYDLTAESMLYSTDGATFTLKAFNGVYKGTPLYLVSDVSTKHTGDFNVKSAEIIESSDGNPSNQLPVRIGINLDDESVVLPVASIVGKDLHFYTLTLDASGVVTEAPGLILLCGDVYNISSNIPGVANNTTLFRPLKRSIGSELEDLNELLEHPHFRSYRNPRSRRVRDHDY